MRRRFWALMLAICLGTAQPAEGFAFTRGMASKIRALQSQAYAEHLTQAGNSFKSGDFEKCVQEASLALQHADSTDKAVPAHKLLAAAHTKLGDRASAAPHLAWLSSHQVPL